MKLVVRALGLDAPVAHDDDLVGIDDGGQAVRDDDERLAATSLPTACSMIASFSGRCTPWPRRA